VNCHIKGILQLQTLENGMPKRISGLNRRNRKMEKIAK
jgi:hypothetical protein